VWRGVHTRLGLKKGRTNVKHRALLVAAALVGATTLAVSLSVAAAGTAPAKQTSPAGTSATAPPKVPNAAAIKAKYHGQKITFVGDSVGGLHARDLALASRFKKDTGITVNVVPHPTASDASYAQLARNFSSKSSSFDVMMVDVVWPGAFAPYLVDLKPKLGKASKAHVAGIVQNDTIGGKLVAMPWFGDYGILYYRTDLLKKYGYSAPPKTWNQLFQMAAKIQAGERKSNDSFYGFAFQGNSYEGLTCDALEWIASAGGGHYIDNGKVTINNKNAQTILDGFRTNLDKISPKNVTTFQENETQTAFTTGNAAFARNWPYMYANATKSDSKVAGKFNVTVLPHGAKGPSVGTVGGWQLAVSKYSKHKDAAIEFVRYATSAPVETWNATQWSLVPTRVAVAKNKAVVKANPYLKPAVASVPRVTRPAKYLKGKYNSGSKVIYQGINEILRGTPAKNVLPSIESKLKRLLR
jgi:trehalose/maltose transport system substrate-binding protein